MPTTAHAPGSVTTVFVPRGDDGSLGVSFATADGVTATVEPAPETTVVLDGAEADVAPVAGVLERLDASCRVRLDTEIPIGCGFGVSGAATLATALAANAEHSLGRDREALVEAAHRAEVDAGTGLGDVFVQNRGGVVWNAGDGVRRVERDDSLQYESHGGISTAEVLGDDDAMARITDAGTDALAALDPEGPLDDVFEASWRFAERVGLPTPTVAERVAEVAENGGTATMAMVGETVVAVGDADALDNETRVSPTGATLQ